MIRTFLILFLLVASSCNFKKEASKLSSEAPEVLTGTPNSDHPPELALPVYKLEESWERERDTQKRKS